LIIDSGEWRMSGSEEDSDEANASARNEIRLGEAVPPRSGMAKRGCLKSKDFYLAANFDRESMGFEDFLEEGKKV